MSKPKIKKGDLVIVIAGKDKGRQGTVLSVLNNKGTRIRVVVEGVNLLKHHRKGNPNTQTPGGIIEKEASIDISNVALFNQATGEADRVGYKILEDGRKVRIYKSTQEVVV